MGALNAPGWLLVVGAGGSTDELFDFAAELYERLEAHDPELRGGPQLHGFGPELRERGVPRYCFHPLGTPEPEFRSNDLKEALTFGCAFLARMLPEHEMWRRD